MLPIVFVSSYFIYEIFFVKFVKQDLFLYVFLAVFVVWFCAEIFAMYTQPYKKIIKKE